MTRTEIVADAQQRIEEYRRLRREGLICLTDDFVPAVHYPAITAYPPAHEEELFAGYTNPADNRFDIYVHFPFCATQCFFCHYPVLVGRNEKEKDRYLDALEKELAIYMERLRLDRIDPRAILVGGGTPTELSLPQLKRFLEFFTRKLDLTSHPQFNYDVDPKSLLGALGLEKLRLMKEFGVNRITIGAQSLDDEILRKMGRNHTAREVVELIEAPRDMGFDVNIEFIFEFPGQTLEGWMDEMERAVGLGTEEIQLYRLKIIPYGDRTGTVTKRFQVKREDFPPAELTLTMKKAAHGLLNGAGYQENLSRVFSRDPEKFSRYADNQCCKLRDQIGIGLTAFSSLRDRFTLNTQSFEEYYSMIGRGQLPVNRGLARNREQQARWSMILPLKNRSLHKPSYQKMNGLPADAVFPGKIGLLKKHGLLIEDDRFLALTELGRFFADEVVQQFYHPDFMPHPRASFADGELNPWRTDAIDDFPPAPATQ